MEVFERSLRWKMLQMTLLM